MSDVHTITIDDINPKNLLTINEQNRGGHWVRKRAVDYWKTVGNNAINRAKLPPMPRVRITVWFRFPNNHVRDTGNLYPVAKALVDVIHRSGVIPGDDDRYLIGPDLRRDPENGPHQVRIDIEEVV